MRVSKIKSVLAVLALGAGIAVIPATTAQAAPGCWKSGTKWWCNNVGGAGVYRWEGVDGTTKRLVGRMNTTTSWFNGRSDCNHPIYNNGSGAGAPHPYRWIYTQADNGEWGWMSDKDIYNETNPLPAPQPCAM
ncbi:hypothetical protein ABZY19_36690 [Streptomyces sp. NPDC006475]|uniref:hypothetical protein n=1 Tax=Streptomyces sp. NPDC006475 TaxID=3155719 RepID=UPI0033B8E4FD